MERCRREIAAIQAELRAGNPDVGGLLLALADWHAELDLRETSQTESTNYSEVQEFKQESFQ